LSSVWLAAWIPWSMQCRAASLCTPSDGNLHTLLLGKRIKRCMRSFGVLLSLLLWPRGQSVMH